MFINCIHVILYMLLVFWTRWLHMSSQCGVSRSWDVSCPCDCYGIWIVRAVCGLRSILLGSSSHVSPWWPTRGREKLISVGCLYIFSIWISWVYTWFYYISSLYDGSVLIYIPLYAYLLYMPITTQIRTQVVALHFSKVAVQKSIDTKVHISIILGMVGPYPDKDMYYATLRSLQTSVQVYINVDYDSVGNGWVYI